MGSMWLVGILFLLSLGFIIAGLIISRTHDRSAKASGVAGQEDAVTKFIEEKLPAERHSFLRAWVDFATGANEAQSTTAAAKKSPEEIAAEVQRLMAEEQNKEERHYEWHEIFRVVRHDDGNLAINFQGRYYPNLAAINEWIHRETVTELLSELGIVPETAAAQPAPEASPPPTTDERIAIKVGERFYRNLSEIPDSQQREFIRTLLLGPEAAPRRADYPKPKSKSGFKLPAISLTKDKKEDAALTPPERSFLVEVQEILDRKIIETSSYSKGEVKLVAGATGELEIHTRYGVFLGVGDVTDAEIRQLIADSVQEWESRSAKRSGGKK